MPYELREVSWKETHAAKYRFPDSILLATYSESSQAEAERKLREDEVWARPGFDPFQYGGKHFSCLSTMPPAIFCDWLEDDEIEPPADRHATNMDTWAEWWLLYKDELSVSQLLRVRAGLNLLHFYEVKSIPEHQETLFVVSEIHWTYNDQPSLDADAEGGIPTKAFRDRAKADAYCQQLNEETRASNPYSCESYNYTDRVGSQSYAPEGYLPVDQAIFYEVTEVPMRDLTS